MKKIILASIIVVISVMTVLFFKGRLNMNMFSGFSQGADLIIVNDSAEDISTAIKENGKEVDTELKPGDKASGGKGFIRVYTAKKAGSYELQYPFPRPAGATNEVTVSQIMAAARKETMIGEVYEKKGMTGDITVVYEEVEEVDVL